MLHGHQHCAALCWTRLPEGCGSGRGSKAELAALEQLPSRKLYVNARPSRFYVGIREIRTVASIMFIILVFKPWIVWGWGKLQFKSTERINFDPKSFYFEISF